MENAFVKFKRSKLIMNDQQLPHYLFGALHIEEPKDHLSTDE